MSILVVEANPSAAAQAEHDELRARQRGVPTVPPAQTVELHLAEAFKARLKDVIIVGYDEHGDLYIRHSDMRADKAVFLLSLALRVKINGAMDHM